MTHPVTDGPAASPVGYILRFPGSWWHLDLNPNTRDASIRRRIEYQAKDTGLPREQVDKLIRSARATARDAQAQGALQASGMVRVLSEDLVLSATAVLLRVSVPEEESQDLADLVVAAGVQLGADAEGTGLPPGEVEVLELPDLGPVGRITRVEDVDHRGTPVRTAMRHTLIPVPQSGDYLVLACSTPNIEYMEHFFEVFDAIAETFRFEDPADLPRAGAATGAAGAGPAGARDNGK